MLSRKNTCFFILLILLLAGPAAFCQPFAKDPKRGTIHVKKKSQKHYYINRENSLYKPAKLRTFTVRAYGCTIRESFPEGYTSEIYPLVFNDRGLLMVDAKRNYIPNEILGYSYEIFKGNIGYGLAVIKNGDGGDMIIKLRRLPKGSCLWVKGLYYKDKAGKIHYNKIGEFKIEKLS
jgi:hypothetical protein